MGVHPTAIVHDGAELGEGVHVGPGCIVGPNVRLGSGCKLHAQVILDGDTVFGENCEIYPQAIIGMRPQDKKLTEDSPCGKLIIGSHNQIREHVTIHGGTPMGSGLTKIGDHNMLLIGSHIGHDCEIGNHVVFSNGSMAGGHSLIEDYAILGAKVGVHQYSRIGTRAMIGGNSMVSHDAPPYCMVQGDRARLVGVNVIGMKRAGMDPELVGLIKRVFRLLFWRSGLLKDRLTTARKLAEGYSEVDRIFEFVETSKRGLCMPRGRTNTGSDAGLIDS